MAALDGAVKIMGHEGMGMHETGGELTITVDKAVATVTIDRADKHNAINRAVWEAIGPAMAALDADPNVKVVILTGAGGKAFSAGADISEFAETYRTPETTRAYNGLVRRAQQAVSDVAKPVIAMIDGLCIGGGCGLALACDLRFAGAASRFAIPPAKIGAAYSFADTRQLVDLVGPARAKDILFSGAMIDARRAERIGLVDRVLPSEQLTAETRAYAEQLCALSQTSIRVAKRMVDAIAAGCDEETEALRAAFEQAFEGRDFREGYDAFLTKRKPDFD